MQIWIQREVRISELVPEIIARGWLVELPIDIGKCVALRRLRSARAYSPYWRTEVACPAP